MTIEFGDWVEINTEFPFSNPNYHNGSKCLVIEIDRSDIEQPYNILKEGQEEPVWASDNDVFKVTEV